MKIEIFQPEAQITKHYYGCYEKSGKRFNFTLEHTRGKDELTSVKWDDEVPDKNVAIQKQIIFKFLKER